MITRRALIVNSMSASIALTSPALARKVKRIPRDWLPTDVAVAPGLAPGVIHVDIAGTWLYLTLQEGVARRYKTAVGAAGRNFSGQARVGRKAEWPAWTPTADMVAKEPRVYGPYKNGLPGGHKYNPLGARALYLYQGNRDTLYRIHGTPYPWTIGESFSSGCIRMMNDHAIDLYDRVPVGAKVIVT